MFIGEVAIKLPNEDATVLVANHSAMRDKQAQARVLRARAESARLFEAGRGNDAAKVCGTLWAAYNGVAEFVDYAVTHRDAGPRLDAIWFGSGYRSKARASRRALTCVGTAKR